MDSNLGDDSEIHLVGLNLWDSQKDEMKWSE